MIKLAHRPRISGAENLPDRPCLLVANHSGGCALSEIACLTTWAAANHEHLPPIAGMNHPATMSLWPSSALMQALGAIPAVKDCAIEALEQGASVLAFPGGAHEATRPICQANTVDFGNHHGFLDVARRANVPIVPIGIRGSHYSAPILWRGGATLSKVLPFYRLLGVKQVPVSLAMVAGAAALAMAPIPLLPKLGLIYLWCNSPLTLLPFVPSSITIRMGEPIPPETLFASGKRAVAYDLVEKAVQDLVAAPRDQPIVGTEYSQAAPG